MAMEWVKAKLAQCRETHVICCSGDRGERKKKLLPKRLLDLRETGNIRLRETSDDEVGEYACLSHCWGNGEILQTTSNTLDQFKDEITWNQLPTMFQETISVLRRLN